MEKFYNLLEWLEINESLEYLALLTNTRLTPENLMFLCSQERCNAFLANLVDGESILPESGFLSRTIGTGTFHRIKFPHPHTWPTDEKRRFCVQGSVTQFDFSKRDQNVVAVTQRFGSRSVENCDWFVELGTDEYKPLFKRIDLNALADAMNGTATQASEIERLRQALEQAQVANKELQRQLNITEGVCEVAQREADELRSQQRESEMVDHLTLEELKEKHLAELEKLRTEEDKPYDKRSRRTIERLIYVLAMEGKYSFKKPYSDAEDIQKAASAIGVMSPGTTDTIVKYLEAAAARIAEEREEAAAARIAQERKDASA